MKQPAVFFDRDQTLIEDPGYISDPDQVRLHDDAAEAIIRLRRAGYRVVVVTNQSGVARGLLTEEQLSAVHRRVENLLAEKGAQLDAIYWCPYLDGPEATVEAYRRASNLRKPGPGMLLRAADDLEIDLRSSWMIGDGARDIEAGRRAGCRTVLLERGEPDSAGRDASPSHLAGSLPEAVDLVLRADAGSLTPAAPTATAAPSLPRANQARSADSLRLLSEIRDLLDRSTRSRRQEDFSLLRLGGTLLQMLAVAAAIWGVFAMFSENNGAAIARLALAAFLQLVTLTVQLSDRRE
jgi:histidinol-phosphate phosphatase family protein